MRSMATTVVQRSLEVKNRLGLHARAAAQFVQTAAPFEAEITVTKDDQVVNGKSILGLMMLAAGPGSKLTVHAEGQDASAALAELENLIQSKFDEE